MPYRTIQKSQKFVIVDQGSNLNDSYNTTLQTLCAIEQNNSKVKQVTGHNPTTEAILTELSKEILNGRQVGSILNDPPAFPKELIDELSVVTALRYWNGQMTYTDGDCIMNNLNIYWMTKTAIDKSDDFFGIAWECYLAFDAGEFYRDNDDRQIEPSEKYTRPLVESLLKKQKLIE